MSWSTARTPGEDARAMGRALALTAAGRATPGDARTARSAGRHIPARMLPAWILALALVLGLHMTAACAVDPTQMPTPALQQRYLSLTHELRCMQCQNESIADSPVDLAADLRREVRDMLLAGKSDDDVRNFMVARYGEFILFRPRMSARNAWLWLAPAVLLLVGVIVAARIIKQRATLVGQDNEPVEEDIRS